MLMPVLGLLLSINQVPVALSIGTFSSTISKIALFRKYICWDIVKYFVPAALPSVILGAILLKYVNPVYLKFIIGIFLISNIPFLFKKPKELQTVNKPNNVSLVIIGFMAGFLSGLTGAVGVIFNKFYLRYGLVKKEL